MTRTESGMRCVFRWNDKEYDIASDLPAHLDTRPVQLALGPRLLTPKTSPDPGIILEPVLDQLVQGRSGDTRSMGWF